MTCCLTWCASYVHIPENNFYSSSDDDNDEEEEEEDKKAREQLDLKTKEADFAVMKAYSGHIRLDPQVDFDSDEDIGGGVVHGSSPIPQQSVGAWLLSTFSSQSSSPHLDVDVKHSVFREQSFAPFLPIPFTWRTDWMPKRSTDLLHYMNGDGDVGFITSGPNRRLDGRHWTKAMILAKVDRSHGLHIKPAEVAFLRHPALVVLCHSMQTSFLEPMKRLQSLQGGVVLPFLSLWRMHLNELHNALHSKAWRRKTKRLVGRHATEQPVKCLPLRYTLNLLQSILKNQQKAEDGSERKEIQTLLASWIQHKVTYTVQNPDLESFCETHTVSIEQILYQMASISVRSTSVGMSLIVIGMRATLYLAWGLFHSAFQIIERAERCLGIRHMRLQAEEKARLLENLLKT